MPVPIPGLKVRPEGRFQGPWTAVTSQQHQQPAAAANSRQQPPAATSSRQLSKAAASIRQQPPVRAAEISISSVFPAGITRGGPFTPGKPKDFILRT